MKQYMKIGTVFGAAFPRCLRSEEYYLQCLERIAKDDFYDAIEIAHIPDAELRKKASVVLKDSGMTVAYCAQPVIVGKSLNLNSVDKKEREKALWEMRECIDEALELGAESFSFLTGRYEEDKIEEQYGHLRESVEKMCGYAGSRIHIEIEIFDYDIEKCSLIGPSFRAAKLAEDIRKKYKNFWLLPDLSHFPQQRETMEEVLRYVFPYMRRTHIGNCVVSEGSPVYGDYHPPYSYPDSAISVKETAEYLRRLRAEGFLNKKDRPMVSFEINPFTDSQVEIVLQENKDMLVQAWEMSESKQ